jgi:hypothetical protein
VAAHRSARLAGLTAVVACAALLAVAGAAAAQDPTTSEPPTTAAPPTTAPTTAPPPTTASPTTARPTTTATTQATTTTGPDGGDDSDVDWALVALVAASALVAVLLIALLAAAASRRSRARATLDRRIAHLVGGAEWLHDQASLDLVGAAYTPDRLRSAWADTRRRVNDLGAEAATLAADAHDERLRGELGDIGRALGLLGGALDTSVGLRLQESGQVPGAAMASAEAADVVNQRRHQLRAAIAPLAARV